MPVERSVVQSQLNELGDFHRFFTSKEIAYLPAILAEGETIHGITSGFYEAKTWIIVITNLRLLFLDKGMFYGLKQVDMPLSQISSIAHRTGFFFGEIEVATASGKRKIESISKRDVLKIASIISGLIHGGRARPTPASAGSDLASQLERLAVLHEKGALTEEEFHLSKSNLLQNAHRRAE
jgi:hypothetical protein